MSIKWRLTILVGGLALGGLAFGGGGLSHRIRFDHEKTAALSRYGDAEHQWPLYTPFFLELEPKRATLGPGANAAPWTAHLRKVEEALAARNISAAERAWHDAYGEALRSRRWEGLIEAGGAYLRIGEVARGRKVAEPQARRAYLTAFFRARSEGSIDGVLRAAEAFAALGDREVVEQCLRSTERLAEKAPDARARERVYAFRTRLAAPMP